MSDSVVQTRHYKTVDVCSFIYMNTADYTRHIVFTVLSSRAVNLNNRCIQLLLPKF